MRTTKTFSKKELGSMSEHHMKKHNNEDKLSKAHDIFIREKTNIIHQKEVP